MFGNKIRRNSIDKAVVYLEIKSEEIQLARILFNLLKVF